MPKRGAGFGDNEIGIMLDAIEEYLPIGQNDWEFVERMHSRYYPQAGRTKESLKRKFQQLHLTKIPAGDPKCPDNVKKRAKYLMEEIKKRAELSDGGDNQEDEDDEEDEEEEEEHIDGGGEEEAAGGATPQSGRFH